MSTGVLPRLDPRERALLTAIFVLTVAMRLMLLFWAAEHRPERLVTADSPTYEQSALALVKLHRFATAPLPDAPPQNQRTPGYPLFIALCYALFGQNLLVVLAFQVFLSGLIPVLVYLISRSLSPRGAPLLAALFYLGDVNGHYTSCTLMTETLFILWMLAGVLVLVRLIELQRLAPAWIATASICFCFATLTRPITYYLLPCLAVGLVSWSWFTTRAWRSALSTWIAWSLPMVLLIGGWQLRNQATDNYPGFASITHRSLLEYRAAGVLMFRDQISFEAARDWLRAQVTDAETLPSRDKWARWDAVSKPILRENPTLVLRTMLLGLKKMLLYADDTTFYEMITGTPSREDFYGDFENLAFSTWLHKWWFTLRLKFCYSMLNVTLLFVAYGLACMTMLRLFKAQAATRWSLLLLGAILLYQIAVSAGPEAYSRFRVPIAPLIFVLAEFGAISRREDHYLLDPK